MANKGAVKKTKKELDAEKKSRMLKIILAAVLVLIMIIVPLATLFNPTSLHNVNDNSGQKTGSFSSISDALMDVPQSANYVRYVDLNASATITNWTMANLGNNLPSPVIFGRTPYRDAVAAFPYPTLGLANVEDPQVVVLSDFGHGYDNASYQKTTVGGAQLRIVQGTYGFSTDTYPTVSGRQEYVALIDSFIQGSTPADSAYATYSDLIQQVNQSVQAAKFAVAGTSTSLGFGDRFYAAVTPLNDTMCDYRIAIHLNQTLNDSQMQDIADRWTTGASLYGIDAMAPQFKGGYVVMTARGDIENCLNDMVTNWDFVRG
jgi:hypothetical protein